MSSKNNLNLLIIGVLALVVVAGGGFFGYQKYQELGEQIITLQSDLKVKDEGIAALQVDNTRLSDELAIEKGKNEEFADQIGNIGKTVGTLEKLKKTDPELLAKYSKVYFLNENYVPKDLALINEEWWVNKDKPMQTHAEVKDNLEDLLEAAQDGGVDLLIASAYRSFGTQADLKANYRFTYGASTANSFSAEQGYSEHQLGTTVDLTTPEIGSILAGFDKTEAYKWLLENAHDYGFILSYPPNNGYYQYEPWHWRYVGVDLASDLHRDGKNFYDLDQRAITEYLVKLFD